MPTPGQPLSVSSGDILSFVPTGCPPDRQMPLILYTAPAFAAIQRAPMSDDVQSPSPSPSVLTASSPDAESALTDAIDNDSIHTRAANKAGAEVTERPISLRSSSQDNDSVLATSPEPAAAFLDNGEITESDSAVNVVDYEYSNVRVSRMAVMLGDVRWLMELMTACMNMTALSQPHLVIPPCRQQVHGHTKMWKHILCCGCGHKTC